MVDTRFHSSSGPISLGVVLSTLGRKVDVDERRAAELVISGAEELPLAGPGHLALAATIVESYRALPPGDAWMDQESIRGLVFFGGVLFAAGLSIALPVGFAIILVQLVMGMLARSAPQLNLFSVGLPAALLAGIVLLAMAAPIMGDGIIAVLQQGLEESRRLALG